MFHVELAPRGGILGPLKSDLGVFWAKIPLYPYNIKFSNSIFSKSANLPILSFWILNLHIIIGQFQKRSTVKHFLSLTPCSCHLCLVSSVRPPAPSKVGLSEKLSFILGAFRCFLDNISFPVQTTNFCLQHVIHIPSAYVATINLRYPITF